MSERFLPPDYHAREQNTHFLDVPSDLVYQPHVYEAAAWMARRAGLRRIVDVGCGSGGKLVPLQSEFDVIGIDCAPALELTRNQLPGATLIETDLEFGLPADLDPSLFTGAVVVCADVIEHIVAPEALLDGLVRIAEHAAFVLVSTPDRDRARGLLDVGPPGNPAHVREWSATELLRWFRARGFDTSIGGYTINTNRHRAKSTILAIGGRLAATPGPAAADFRVAAIIHAFNEADVLPEVVAHLAGQGVEVHLFDNWSTDDTWSTAEGLRDRGLIQHLARFPERPGSQYEWARQLELTAVYGRETGADWILHHDADEIRRSPWPGVSLRDALAAVTARGFNAIDFTVIDFRFTRDQPAPPSPFEQSLTHFEFGRRPGHFQQVKGWNHGGPVDLASSGGHDVAFDGRKIFPMKFLLKHYPLRSRTQAERKIFRDRLPRTESERRERNWHTQYDALAAQSHVEGWAHSDLIPWNTFMFDSEFLVERLTGLGLTDR